MLPSTTALLRTIKFSHTLFALPFAVMAAFLAGAAGQPGFCGWQKLILIIWCMVAARSVAMTFNRIVDADIDRRNPRTATRPLAIGQVGRKTAILFMGIFSALFTAAAALFWKPLGPWFGFGNYWPAVLALPVLLFICLYSLTKRFTWASHFWLGAALMLAPVGTCVAVSPPLGPVITPAVLILGGAVLLWTAGFDIIYACQDVQVDRRQGLHSLPAKLGIAAALWISRACHAAALMMFLLLTIQPQLDIIYRAALAVTALLLLCQHLLVRRGRMTHINIAFGTINGLVSVLLAAAAICDILG